MTDISGSSQGFREWAGYAIQDARSRTHNAVRPNNFLGSMVRVDLIRELLSQFVSNGVRDQFDIDVEKIAGVTLSVEDYMGQFDSKAKTPEMNEFTKHLLILSKNEKIIGVSHGFLALIRMYPALFSKYNITIESVAKVIPSTLEKVEKYAPKIEDRKRADSSDKSPHELNSDDAKADTPYLDRFGKDLTKEAVNGELDPTIGRDEETRQVIKILSRRTKNTPILVGDPGIGKAKIVEGIAQRIVSGDVPKSLKGRKLISLDMTALVAGANMRGELEERLQKVISELESSAGLIVLFINEIHLINANDNSAGEVLKPALAKGLIRLIGSTTTDEFREHIESDSALMRRFQKISIEEPTKDEAVTILRGVAQKFEEYHEVQISDDAIIAAVEMSTKYVNDRVLPDKALDAIDEAATKLRIELDSSPLIIDRKQRALNRLRVEEIALLRGADINLIDEAIENDEDDIDEETDEEHNERIKNRARNAAERQDMLEELAKNNHYEAMLPKETLTKLAEIRSKKADIEEQLVTLKVQWSKEKKTRKTITELRNEMKELLKETSDLTDNGEFEEASKIEFEEIPKIQAKLDKAEASLVNPLVAEHVSQDEVAKVIENWTGIPVGKLLAGEAQKLIEMENIIGEKVIGQASAINAISDAVRRSRAGVNDPNKPTGSFMFAGSSGTGKTYLAKILAEFLFDDKNAMIRIDMSEYGEKHSSAKLIGAPPGYVGYESGGVLTEAVRKNPYSVVLFDEIEKAHPETFDLLLQVLDDGHVTDSSGKVIDFKNTIIVLTTNLGSAALVNDELDRDEQDAFVMEAIRNHFRPEFLNRLDEMVIFNPFSKDDLIRIVETELKDFIGRLESRGFKFSITAGAKSWLAENGYEPAYGARPLKRLIQKELGDTASKLILSGELKEEGTIAVSSSRDKKQLIVKAK